MESRVVQGILKSELVPERKLELIEKLYKLMTEFEAFSERESHKGWKVVAEEFASSRGIDRKRPNKKDVKTVLRKGIQWLIQHQHKDEGWGWIEEKRFSSMAWEKCSREKSSSLPWDTAVATLVLNDWGKFFREQDTRSLVRSGLKWLESSQNEDGGWGGLISVNPEGPSNAIETGASLWVFCLTRPPCSERIEAINRGLNFLARLKNEDGSYSLQPGLCADAKSTAISMAVNHCYEENLEQIPCSVSWLLKNQKSAGNWTWQRGTYGQIDATFYAIEALRIHYLHWKESRVLEPMKKAVNWYEDEAHLVIQQEHAGWAWDDAESTAAAVIALLDSGEPDSLPSIERGIEWLLARLDPQDFWSYETPLSLLALIRYLEPESRMEPVIEGQLTKILA